MKGSFEHYLLTRFNIRIASMLTKQLDAIDISRNELYLKNRFRLFFTYTAPSVISQTNKNFEWIILFSDNTPEQFKSRMHKLTEKHEFIHVLYVKDNENSTDVINAHILKKKCDWLITSRLDNDDALASTYIDDVQSYYKNHEEKKYALIFNDGYQYEEKSCVMARYHFPKNHFSSLLSEYCSSPDSILNYRHTDIDKAVMLKEVNTDYPNWMEIVHDTNVTNRMHFSIKDVVIKEKESEKFGIYNLKTANMATAIKRSIMLKPDNIRIVFKKYGIRKTTAKIIEKVRWKLK